VQLSEGQIAYVADMGRQPEAVPYVAGDIQKWTRFEAAPQLLLKPEPPPKDAAQPGKEILHLGR